MTCMQSGWTKSCAQSSERERTGERKTFDASTTTSPLFSICCRWQQRRTNSSRLCNVLGHLHNDGVLLFSWANQPARAILEPGKRLHDVAKLAWYTSSHNDWCRKAPYIAHQYSYTQQHVGTKMLQRFVCMLRPTQKAAPKIRTCPLLLYIHGVLLGMQWAH